MPRYTLHFSGRVQGVGFRYTAQRVAEPYVLAGYVQNLRDGRVRLVVEGDKDVLDAYVAAIRQRMDRYIKNVTQDVARATGEFGPVVTGGLGIRHG